MEQKQTSTPTPTPDPKAPSRPNETGTLRVDGFVKIFDPNNKEVFVEKRA